MKKIKYYTLENPDGQFYMAYVSLRQARKEASSYSYSGICYEKIVGSKIKKIKFIW